MNLNINSLLGYKIPINEIKLAYKYWKPAKESLLDKANINSNPSSLIINVWTSFTKCSHFISKKLLGHFTEKRVIKLQRR